MAVTHKDGKIMFNTEQLRSCYTMENESGKNDIIYLCRMYRPVEMIRRFGEKNVHEKVVKAYRDGLAITFEVVRLLSRVMSITGVGQQKTRSRTNHVLLTRQINI